MNRALWISKTGLDAQQTNMAVVSNNLANVSTTGFKRDRAIFEDLIYQNIRQSGAQSSQTTTLPSGLSLGTGVRTVATEKLFSEGNIVQTGNSMDVAINGRGFLQILQPDGTVAYTRDGSLQLNNQGQIVTANGLLLQPQVGNIPTNAQSVTIGSDGIVSVQMPGQVAAQQLGTLQLADFVNPSGLQAIGNNLFQETTASGAPQTSAPGLNGMGSLMQGAVESSNVNVVEEMVNMIEVQRAYEMNSKAISTTDQMLGYLSTNV